MQGVSYFCGLIDKVGCCNHCVVSSGNDVNFCSNGAESLFCFGGITSSDLPMLMFKSSVFSAVTVFLSLYFCVMSLPCLLIDILIQELSE